MLWSAGSAHAEDVDWTGRTLPSGVASSRIDVDGIGTRILQAGPASAREAIVFVHGNPGSSLDYAHLVGGIGTHARAVAIDMPGWGAADDPDTLPYSVQSQAEFLERAFARLGIHRVHLVLHDFGGPWGLEWAAGHSDRLASVVLIDTGVFINYYGHPMALAWHTPVTGEVSMETMTRESFKTTIQRQQAPRPLPEPFLDRMYDEFDPATRAASLKAYRSIDNPDAMGRAQAAALRDQQRPALVVWGSFDPYVPLYVAYEQEQAFPGARVEPLDSGHWPMVDNVDKVDGLVLPFLREAVPSPARGLRVRTGRLRRVVRIVACSQNGWPLPGVRAVLRRGSRVIGRSRRVARLSRCARLRVRPRSGVRARGRYAVEVRAAGVAPVRRAVR
jgi:pimeloyl-ACP methyl ester carboxylesterase